MFLFFSFALLLLSSSLRGGGLLWARSNSMLAASSREEPKESKQQQKQTEAVIGGTCASTAVSSASPALSLTRRFLHFLSACHKQIDVPLEAALQQSVELARFVSSIQCSFFFPRQQKEVRWALWELLHDSSGREASVLEMEKQQRLYGGLVKSAPKRVFNFTSSEDHDGNAGGISQGCSDVNSYRNTKVVDRNGEKKNSRSFLRCGVWSDMNEAEEEALLARLRARGRYHMRMPRHAKQCPRRTDRGMRSPRLSQRDSSSHRSQMMPLTESIMGAELRADEMDDLKNTLGSVESLTAGCSLCAAQGLLQSSWLSMYLLRLIDMVVAAHLCAAPLLLPCEALSIKPAEALCVGYHVAEQQLHVSMALLLSISTQPSLGSSFPVDDGYHQRCGGVMSSPLMEDEKAHHVNAISAIRAVAQQGLDLCVNLLSALGCLQPDNVYLTLMHATVLLFFDRQGVSKARRLLLRSAAAMARVSSSTTETSDVGVSTDDCAMYDMWLVMERSQGEKTCSGSEEHALLLLEQVTTGVLFLVFMELLAMKEVSPPSMQQQSIGERKENVVTPDIVLRARNALDTIVKPRVLKLCDAADGAVSTRGRLLQALYWLLRGTLQRLLNALSLVPFTASSSPSMSCLYDAEEPLYCMREAVKWSDAIQEFINYPLMPHWAEAILCSSEGPESEGRSNGNDDVISSDYRLHVDGSSSNQSMNQPLPLLSPQERVTDMALLPPQLMRVWLVFARTLFRSISADLVLARTDDDASSCETSARVQAHMADTTANGDNSNKTTPSNNIGSLSSHTTNGPDRTKKGKGVVLQRTVMAERENVLKVADAQRRTEHSALGFWFRWREACVSNRLLNGSTDNDPSLLKHQCQLMLLASSDRSLATTFMRALNVMYPIVSMQRQQEEWSLEAQLLPFKVRDHQQQQSGQQEGLLEDETEQREPSLAFSDLRLQEAWKRYDVQCVQPFVCATTMGSDSDVREATENKMGEKKPEKQLLTPPQNIALMSSNGERLMQRRGRGGPLQRHQQKPGFRLFDAPRLYSLPKSVTRLAPLVDPLPPPSPKTETVAATKAKITQGSSLSALSHSSLQVPLRKAPDMIQ